MKNNTLSVDFNLEDGSILALRLNDDTDKLNWLEGFGHWGLCSLCFPLDASPSGYGKDDKIWGNLHTFEFIGCEQLPDGLIAHYRHDTLELDVTRRLEEDALTERYVFRNTGTYDLFYRRGDIGILTPFNDSYPSSTICMTNRCHAHIYCGGEVSYIHAMKMGPYPTDVAMILTEGALDTYSVRRLNNEGSNDRGDFLLHPQPFHLLPGQTMTLAWTIIAIPHRQLKSALVNRMNQYWAAFEQETIFDGESFHISLTTPAGASAIIRWEGKDLLLTPVADGYKAKFTPHRIGEHCFEVIVDGRHSRLRGYCSPPLDKLVEARVRFILRHQQVKDPASPLYGSFIPYDNDEKLTYFSYTWRDYNACRERLNMGLLLCRYLQKRHNDEADTALKLLEKFLVREIYNTETGEVYDNVGRSNKYKRPYNTAGLINFWLEVYRLRKDTCYLQWIAKSIRLFYEHGGYRFYPNGTLFANCIVEMRQANLTELADEMETLFRQHVKTICEIGTNFPAHEVRYEQTIATPAVGLLSAFCLWIEPSPEVMAHINQFIELLERFEGEQPDYHLNSLAIRHWDGYWFGRKQLYGDTFPHYLSALSARCYRLYAQVSKQDDYEKHAQKILRNNLCLFREDGSASCAYLFPFSVTMLNPDGSIAHEARRGEYYDPLANDQDGALYLMMCDPSF